MWAAAFGAFGLRMEVPHTQLRPAAPVVEIYGEDSAVFDGTIGVRGHESRQSQSCSSKCSIENIESSPRATFITFVRGASKDSVPRESQEETQISEGVTPTDKVATCVLGHLGDFCNLIDALSSVFAVCVSASDSFYCDGKCASPTIGQCLTSNITIQLLAVCVAGNPVAWNMLMMKCCAIFFWMIFRETCMQMLQRYAVAGWLGTKGRFSESGAAAAAVLLQRGAGNDSQWFTMVHR